ncbi:MAG: MFS transporter [Dehalococcoidia bacterium]
MLGRLGKVFYGWRLVGIGFLLQMLTALFIQRSYAAYVVVFRDQFGWSKTALSGAYSLQQIENGLLGPLQGWVVDRFGPKVNMQIGVCLFSIGLMAFSQVNSLFTFYLSFVTIAIGASLFGFFPITVTVVNWFEKKRARALSTVSLGFATGGLLVPLIALCLDQFGWRNTAFASGVISLVIGLPLTSMIRHRPEPWGEHRDGVAPAAPSAALSEGQAGTSEDQYDFTAKEALSTPAFWLISLGHGSALLVVAAVNVHVISHLNESLGYSLAEASLAITFMTAFQVIGLLIGAAVGDRYNKRYISMACMVAHCVGLLMVAYAAALPMVIGFSVLHGTAWGLRGPLMQALRADYFGRKSFGMIMGFSSMITTIGNLSGPLIAGILADRTGSYETGFTVLAVLAALASVFFLLATPPKPPARIRALKERPEPAAASAAD